MLVLEPAPPLPLAPRSTFLDDVLDRARRLGRRNVAMVYPCDISSLKTSVALVEEGLAVTTLIGPRVQMLELGQREGIDLSQFQLIDSGVSASGAATLACQMAASGEVDMLMKGALHTDDLMRAVVSRDNGLRTTGRISHAFVLQLPERERPLIISDCVVNVAPTLSEKVEILNLVIRFAQDLGLKQPRVAVLSFTESVVFAAQSTVDAAALAKMAERGQIVGAMVDGPLAFDNAVSLTSATSKGIESKVAGNAEVLLMPNLEAGNALYKSLVYMAGAICGGLVLGTRKPVILTSRTDSMKSKLFSAALGTLMLTKAG